MFELARLKGTVTLLKFNKKGEIVEETRLNNLLVNTGLEYAAKLLNGVSTSPFQYIAIGSGSTSPQTTDTALESEVDRTVANTSYESPYKAKFTAIFNFTSFTTIREAGIFNDSSGGNLLSRVTFAAKSFNAGESLGVSWTIEVKRS